VELGFPDDLTKWKLSDAYLKEMRLVPHEIVDTGPVYEIDIIGWLLDGGKKSG